MSGSVIDNSADGWHLPDRYAFRGSTVRHGSMGAGDPLVLLHGTPFSSLVWRRIAPWLAERRKVFYFDLLGYGASDKPDGDVSLGVQNELFAELLDLWGLERPDVVAHDFGGATALRTHILNRRDYRTLTLVDPVAIGPTGSPLVQAARAHEDVFAGLPAYVHEAIVRAYIAGSAANTLREAEMQLYLRPWLGDSGQKAFWRQIAQMSDRYTDDIETRFGEVRCPTAVLWGERDEWIPIELGRELARRIPGATFHAVREAKHLVQEDAPEAIMAIVLSLIGA